MQRNHAPALALKTLSCLWLVMAADWLFYAQPVGWTAGGYALLAIALLCLCRPAAFKTNSAKLLALLLAGLAGAMAAGPGLLPLLLFVTGMAALLLLHKRGRLADAALFVKDGIWLFMLMPLQWSRDRRLLRRLRVKKIPAGVPLRLILTRALLPLVLTSVFCWLFLTANPILARLATQVDWELYFSSFFSPLRWSFWLAVTLAAWAMLRPRSKLANPVGFSLQRLNLTRWLDKNSLVLSLLVFNLIFAVQNGLDIAFIWNGQGLQLPEGLSYAGYAHAGAYPLIVTALLAGAYVLVTFDETQRQYQTPAARVLVVLWVLQNIFLVLSSIDRTVMYIGIYSLTYLRIAALIWMGLVAAGLAFITLRILLRFSNRWLINMNALVLVTTLYLCCFVNFDRMIADYNVRHANEVTGQGVWLDLNYLANLGPEAIPALRWFGENVHPASPTRPAAIATADKLQNQLLTADWRAWTFRRQALIDAINHEEDKNHDR